MQTVALIVGVAVGTRSRKACYVVCYPDFWQADQQVLPSKRHRAVGKQTGKTSLIKRFNNTLRYSSRTLSSQNPIVLKAVGQSHRSSMVLVASLQRLLELIITIPDYPFFEGGWGEQVLTEKYCLSFLCARRSLKRLRSRSP